jgi:hypothetical protein
MKDYSKSTGCKEAFTTNVFQKFTDAVGGDAKEFADELYSKFTVDDFGYHDDFTYWGVLKYFEEKVVPHKIAVYQAGVKLMQEKWFLNFVKPYDVDQYKKNLWLHDLSKFSANEAFGYAMHDFSNPNAKSKPYFEKAWHHHKMNNPHHPEYWLNPNRSGIIEPIPMPVIYIMEMIADWIGAGQTYGSTLEQWLPINIHKFQFESLTINSVQNILEHMGFKTSVNENYRICLID